MKEKTQDEMREEFIKSLEALEAGIDKSKEKQNNVGIDTNDLFEDEHCKFIWGIESADNLMSDSPNLFSMNDFDIVYDKTDKAYYMSVETIYMFKNDEDRKKYIKHIYAKFTKWMNEKGFNTKYKLNMEQLFTYGFSIDKGFKSIEELYATFKMLAEYYIK